MQIKDLDDAATVAISHADHTHSKAGFLKLRGFSECEVEKADQGLSWEWEFVRACDEDESGNARSCGDAYLRNPYVPS